MIKTISRFKMILFLLVMVALCGGYAAAAEYPDAPEAGSIRIRVNVYDWDAAALDRNNKVPVPGVEVGLSRYSKNYLLPTASNIMQGTSDANGVAYIEVPIVSGTWTAPNNVTLNAVYINNSTTSDNIIMITDYPFTTAETIRLDVSPISAGYALNTSVDRLIRNLVRGSHGGECACKMKDGILYPDEGHTTLKAGNSTYNDFVFHGGMPTNGAYVEMDLYVKSQKVTVAFDKNTISNASAFPNQTFMPGVAAEKPTTTPINKNNPEREFLGWMLNGELYDFSQIVNNSILLAPKWGPNTNVRGYIHLDSFLWNHDAYNGTYRSGQTDTTVNELVYKVEYYDQYNSTTSKWNLLTTVTVDANGKADFVLTPEMMQELSDFRDKIAPLGAGHYVAIDIGPDMDARGWHEANHRPLQYAWDWMKMFPGQDHGAGLVGVRMMWVNDDASPAYDIYRDNNHWKLGKNGETTAPIVGNVQYAANENHVPWLTQGMLDDGFEIYWKCYVTPSMTVNFDLNGGTGTGDYTEQKIKPINSLPEQREDFIVKNPGGTVTKGGMIFTGWYKVKADGTTETTPWDFANRVVTESMVLRAGFANKLYKVQFVTPESGTQEKQHKAGDTPAWYGQNPTKTSTAQYDYVFKGWKETAGTHLASEYTFHEAYDFEHQSRVIYGNGSSTPVTVDSTFADLTVYTAQFDEIGQKYTVTWLNYDTTQLKQDINVPYGTLPTYDGAAPVRPADEQYTYSFSGWNPSVVAVTGDATYTAVFTPQAINYIITYDANGGVLSGEATQSYNAETDVTLQTAPARDGKIFAGWKLETAAGNWDAGTYSASQKIGTGKYGNITLVAQWEDGVRDLIIKKKISGGNANPNDRFIFTVTGPDGYSTRVTVAPNGSVTVKNLKVGEYTVQEETDWSWAYTPDPASGKITQDIGSNNTFTFVNKPKDTPPPHAEAGKNNKLEKKSN